MEGDDGEGIPYYPAPRDSVRERHSLKNNATGDFLCVLRFRNLAILYVRTI